LSIVHIRFSAAEPASQSESGEPQRAPVLERLLAHATMSSGAADWRADAFHALAGPAVPVPAVGAAAWWAAHASAAGVWVCMATPVHLVAGMSNVTLSAGGILTLDAGEAESLAADFNRLFGGPEMRLSVGRGGSLLCVFDRTLDVTTHDPQAAVGHDVFAFQASGRDAPRLRRVMSECDMWLFEHELNRRRAARTAPPVTGLWLWGGGPTWAALPPIDGWTAGQDPLFTAFGDMREFPREPGTGVVVTPAAPGSTGWPDVETRWLAPAMAHLRTGALEALELSVGDLRLRVRKEGRWRFWKRPRPWWETLVEGSELHGIQ
jgi:hypothetical protein